MLRAAGGVQVKIPGLEEAMAAEGREEELKVPFLPTPRRSSHAGHKHARQQEAGQAARGGVLTRGSARSVCRRRSCPRTWPAAASLTTSLGASEHEHAWVSWNTGSWAGAKPAAWIHLALSLMCFGKNAAAEENNRAVRDVE